MTDSNLMDLPGGRIALETPDDPYAFLNEPWRDTIRIPTGVLTLPVAWTMDKKKEIHSREFSDHMAAVVRARRNYVHMLPLEPLVGCRSLPPAPLLLGNVTKGGRERLVVGVAA